MKKKWNIRTVMLCAGVMFSLLAVISMASIDCIAKSKSDTIQYNNKVFTKKLYKNTEKIGFGSDGSIIIEDPKTVKKVYKLLAKMNLKTVKKENEEQKDGFVIVVIHTKNGKEKTYAFAGDQMVSGTKKYTITKNNPIHKIQKLLESD